MKLGARLMTSAVGLAVGAATAAAGSERPDIRFVAGIQPGLNGALTVPGGAVTALEHVSASPGGRMVAVGRLSVAQYGGQGIWVRDAGEGGAWQLRLLTGQARVNRVAESNVQSITGAPIVNDRGEVLFVGSMVGLHGVTTTPVQHTALLRSNVDGSVDVIVRFSATAGPGVPYGLPIWMPMVSFSGPATDSWRFSASGPLHSSMASGLIGPCTVGGPNAGAGPTMCMRTIVNRSQNSTAFSGTAIPVGSARSPIVMTGNGFSVQSVGASGYVRDQLTGLVMFDPYGIGAFAVRDGTTAVEGLPGQVVLQTLTGGSDVTTPAGSFGGSRMGMNSDCMLVFTAKFGEPVMASTDGPTSVPAVIVAPTGLLVKEPFRPARVIAQVPLSNGTTTPTLGAPAGLDGAKFTGLGTPMVSASGQIAFAAGVSSPALGSRASLWHADKGGRLTLLAMTGVSAASGEAGAPAWPGAASFTSLFSEPTINRRGQVVFSGRISVGATAESPAATFDALCAWDPTTGGSVLVRTGDRVTLPSGAEATITFAELADIGGRPQQGSGNDDGAATRLTDDGRVVIRVATAGAGTSILSVQVPTASGACCAGATCEVRDALDCNGAMTRFTGANTVCSTGGGSGRCCPADFDQNRRVGMDDLFGFIAAWMGSDPMTDLSGDGSTGADDLIGFVQAFLGGC